MLSGAVTSRSTSKPGSIARAAAGCAEEPAAIRSTSDSATSARPAPASGRSAPGSLPAGRSSFSAGTRPGRDAASAGGSAEHQAGERSTGQREQQHATIDREVERRAAARRPAAAPPANACTSAQARPTPRAPPSSDEQHALGEQLPDEPAAAGAERQADRDLAPARRGARQQQVGDVRARDQQHGADHAAEQQRPPSACCGRGPSPGRPRRPGATRGARGRRGRQFARVRTNSASTGSSSARACSMRDARLQPADAEEPAVGRMRAGRGSARPSSRRAAAA